MKRRTLYLVLLAMNALALYVVWEQPDCAAAMPCRGTVTIGEAFERLFN